MDDLEEMPMPHYRPISYVKISILWGLYYLKNNKSFEEAVKDMIERGGDTQANGAIVGGLIGAAKGLGSIDQNHIKAVLTVPNQDNDLELGGNSNEYHPGKAISTTRQSKIHGIISNAPAELVVKWDGEIIRGQALKDKIEVVFKS